MTYKNWNNNIGTREQEFFQNTSPLMPRHAHNPELQYFLQTTWVHNTNDV